MSTRIPRRLNPFRSSRRLAVRWREILVARRLITLDSRTGFTKCRSRDETLSSSLGESSESESTHTHAEKERKNYLRRSLLESITVRASLAALVIDAHFPPSPDRVGWRSLEEGRVVETRAPPTRDSPLRRPLLRIANDNAHNSNVPESFTITRRPRG